ncbi:hypothetical protein [Rhodococcus spongiicola]|uniref:Uncharacterized protein n=1 Tax=Rhodococcus spongiicola TaxID=2487352 RepID=A0A3S3BPM4_9NOCA|nr:hypothetical protein [Rhodococcus spongiicola]RVW06224.1 hypothetical protein EF834_01855 [Rhodococcus spongiicola]
MPDTDFDAFDDNTPGPQRGNNGGKRGKKRRNNIPEHAPAPQDRPPKKSPQQAEAEDIEIRITAFDDEFRIRRSELQDNWQFFAASAVGNVPGMLVQLLGRDGFVLFCQRAMEAGKTPGEATKEMWDLIAQEVGVGDLGN